MEKKKDDQNPWTTSPPDHLLPAEYQIIRTPPKGALQGICISPNVFGKVTHFYRGRTGPCRGPGCDGCLGGIRRAWHGWILFFSPKNQRTVIFEFPAGAGRTIAKARSTYSSLKGVHFKFHRFPERAQGQVYVETLKVEQHKDWLRS